MYIHRAPRSVRHEMLSHVTSAIISAARQTSRERLFASTAINSQIGAVYEFTFAACRCPALSRSRNASTSHHARCQCTSAQTTGKRRGEAVVATTRKLDTGNLRQFHPHRNRAHVQAVAQSHRQWVVRRTPDVHAQQPLRWT